jgi:HSP20 family protein
MYLTDIFSRGGRDLFSDLERLIDAFDRSSASAFMSSTATTGLDLWANEDGLQVLQVTLDAPGLDPASIELAVLGDTLTIKAKAMDENDEQRTWLRKELSSGMFTRTVRLPYAVDAEHAEARYADGVISVTLQRQASSKPQRIAIKAA